MNKAMLRRPIFLKILFLSWLIVLVSLLIYLFTGGLTTFHSDSAAPVNLALEMIRTGEWFPNGWIGSTGIFLFQYPIWFFLHFTSDLLLAKTMAQVVFLGLFLLTSAFCIRKLLNNHSWIIFFLIVCSAISVSVVYEMLYVQCAYTSVMILGMLTLGFSGWSVESYLQCKINRRRFALFLIEICLVCSQGILFVGLIALPVLGAIVILYLQRQGGETLENSWKSIKYLLPYLFLIIVAIGIGTGLSFLMMELSGVVGNSGTGVLATSVEQIIRNLTFIVEAVLFYTDFSTGANLFSLNGILSLMRLGVFLALTIFFPILSFRKYREMNEKSRFLHLFVTLGATVAILIVLVTNIPDYIATARYLLTSILFLQLLSANYIYNHYICKINLMAVVYSVCISVVSISLIFSIVPSIANYKNSLEAMKGITNFLAENRLNYGYATFWNAGKNTILSNGTVQVNGILLSEDRVLPYYWLTSRDWYDSDYYEGKTFLLLTNQEAQIFAPDGYEKTALGAPESVLTYGDYVILAYDRNISENQFTAPVDGTYNYLSKMICSDPAMLQMDGTVSVSSGQVLYGPYLSLPSGEYILTIAAEDGEDDASLRISANSGEEIISMETLKNGENIYHFVLNEDKEGVEFAISYSGNVSIAVQSVYLSKEIN